MKKYILPLILTCVALTSCNKIDINENSAVNSKPVESSSTSTETTSSTNNKPSSFSDLTSSSIYSGTYYDSISSIEATTLKSQLNALINSNYTKISYSNCTTKLKTIDSYDSNYVECLYSGVRLNPDNSGSNAGQWNKEHIWAKTYGFGEESYQAYSDLQMLRVTECSINGKRSDKYFAESSVSTDDYGNSWSDTTFEPRDEVKGDVARIMFYMTVMYDSDTLDLELTDEVSLINSSHGQKGGTQYLGLLSTVLQWAKDDPVDEREISRNNKIYEIQGNRNPFIDHPEYAYYIFKDKCDSLGITYDDLYDNNTYVSKNSEAINYINSKIDSIGTVTLESESLINEINELYNKLGNVSKSFVTGYYKLQQAIYSLNTLKDLTNRDTTISTTIDLTGISDATFSTAKNGISINGTCSLANANKGIYSQTTKSITIKASNLYASIKKCNITLCCNKNTPTANITISDGVNNVTQSATMSQAKTVYTLDLSTLDLSKELTITIENKTGNSIICSLIEFAI